MITNDLVPQGLRFNLFCPLCGRVSGLPGVSL